MDHRFLRSAAHVLVYELYLRRAMKRTDRVKVLGLRLEIPPTVFHPVFALTSRFLGEYLRSLDLTGKRLLDMGCGSGVLGLLAAREGAEVTAVDINPAAAAATRSNAGINGLDRRIRVIQGDLFEGMSAGELFDYIVWNPPFYPKEPVDVAARAWNAGKEFAVIGRFADSAGDRLVPGGKIILVLSSDTDTEAILRQFTLRGFSGGVVRRERRLFESLSIAVFGGG